MFKNAVSDGKRTAMQTSGRPGSWLPMWDPGGCNWEGDLGFPGQSPDVGEDGLCITLNYLAVHLCFITFPAPVWDFTINLLKKDSLPAPSNSAFSGKPEDCVLCRQTCFAVLHGLLGPQLWQGLRGRERWICYQWLNSPLLPQETLPFVSLLRVENEEAVKKTCTSTSKKWRTARECHMDHTFTIKCQETVISPAASQEAWAKALKSTLGYWVGEAFLSLMSAKLQEWLRDFRKPRSLPRGGSL